MANFLLAASILAADFTCLRDQIGAAEAAGADWIHVDVMDGHFVPNISMGPLIVEACRRITKLPLDVHLMISHPENFVEDFAHAGANKITVHIEEGSHIHRTLESIRVLNVSPAITLNPGTPAAALQAVLPFVDMVLVMSVNPGFGGQKFIPQSLEKITEIRAMLDGIGSRASIEVDGGINHETLPSCLKAGANVFVAGNSVFNHPQGIAAGIQALRKSVA
jgi:ribulose-phosphate 3-epimerase